MAYLLSLVMLLGASKDNVDASTIQGKTLCGYQGWFRCPGDAGGRGWVHWSGDGKRILPETLTFEMWPDMTEYDADEQCDAPGFAYPDGSQARLYTAENAKTVLRHFKWMAQYGIHGVWLQRFLVGFPGGPDEFFASSNRIMDHVRDAARETGRIWAIAFDMAAMPSESIYDAIATEWKRVVDTGVTADERYLHERGLPVVMVWGFYPKQNITPAIANRIIDFFKADSKYRAYLCGGCEWEWRTDSTPGWPEFLRRFDAICPWNVGNYGIDGDGKKWASTHYWKEDLAEAKRVGMSYLPVFYPGFSWDNLKHFPAGRSNVPREGGKFLWRQFCAAAELGLEAGYIAMFDEVDEGTAIYKITNTPPTQAHFVGYEGLPSDWYLRLAGEGTRMLLHERPFTAELPIHR